jgi:uridine kinase
MKPHLIGVAGPSCAGKSTLAAHLVSRLGGAPGAPAVGVLEQSAARFGAAVLSLDSYYRPLDHLSPPERALYNFDLPEALDSGLLLEHARQLHAGHVVQCPVYDFAAHTRTGESIEIAPCPFIVIEGLFALYWEELRALLGTKVYVDLDEERSLQRRTERDMRERGRTRESVLLQYQATVAPMARRYVYPARAHADLLVSGDASPQHAGSGRAGDPRLLEADSEYSRQVEAVLRHALHGGFPESPI